jgi:hypothetical protein
MCKPAEISAVIAPAALSHYVQLAGRNPHLCEMQAGDDSGTGDGRVQAPREQLQPHTDQFHGESDGDQWHWGQDLLP